MRLYSKAEKYYMKNNRYYRSVVREINGAAQSFVDPYVLVFGGTE